MFTLAPPPYAQQKTSDDPDEVTGWVAQRYGQHSRVVHGKGPYGYVSSIAKGRETAVNWAQNALGQTIRAVFPQHCIHIPLAGAQHYVYGRRPTDIVRGEAMFIPAGTEITRRSGSASILAIQIDGAAFADEATARAADFLDDSAVRPRAVDLSFRHHALQEALQAQVAALSPDASTNLLPHCEQRLIAAVVETLSSTVTEPRAGKLAARRLAALERWIDAHIDEPITIGHLCRVAGVGERCLQLAFQSRRGMSPMRFVLERRLAAAHALLSRAEVSGGVTDIATRAGFTHLGRFSVSYRQAFGESPSQTMQRRRVSAG